MCWKDVSRVIVGLCYRIGGSRESRSVECAKRHEACWITSTDRPSLVDAPSLTSVVTYARGISDASGRARPSLERELELCPGHRRRWRSSLKERGLPSRLAGADPRPALQRIRRSWRSVSRWSWAVSGCLGSPTSLWVDEGLPCIAADPRVLNSPRSARWISPKR